MGGDAKTAMNIVCFPMNQMDISILRRILEGGSDKMREAGVVLVGGHSVEDNELKYGLSVTGFIHPDQILTKRSLAVGDQLILTKPLGSGIINTAIKAGLVKKDTIARVIRLMAALNRNASEIMRHYPVHGCTDITGFGLLGHLAEMVTGSGCSVSISAESIPVIPEASEYAAMGLIPAGAHRNREFREPMVEMSPSVDRALRYILFDPQTSGGLLIGVERESSDALLDELKQKEMSQSAIIGEVLPGPDERIRVIP